MKDCEPLKVIRDIRAPIKTAHSVIMISCGNGARGVNFAPALPGYVVTKWRDMKVFLASKEWDGVHQYGYVFEGDGTFMGEISVFICMCSTCELHYILRIDYCDARPFGSALLKLRYVF